MLVLYAARVHSNIYNNNNNNNNNIHVVALLRMYVYKCQGSAFKLNELTPD